MAFVEVGLMDFEPGDLGKRARQRGLYSRIDASITLDRVVAVGFIVIHGCSCVRITSAQVLSTEYKLHNNREQAHTTIPTGELGIPSALP